LAIQPSAAAGCRCRGRLPPRCLLGCL